MNKIVIVLCPILLIEVKDNYVPSVCRTWRLEPERNFHIKIQGEHCGTIGNIAMIFGNIQYFQGFLIQVTILQLVKQR